MMPFANLSTTVTDIGIAIEAVLFCGLLFKSDQQSQRCWAIAFGCVAIAATLGSIYHGLTGFLPQHIIEACQTLTAYTIGIASGMMLCGTIKSSLSPAIQPWLMGIIGLKFWLFCSFQNQYQGDFSVVVVDYLSAMLILWVLEMKAYVISPHSNTYWLTSGIATSVIAASLLALHWSPVPILSPEAIYHIVQMIALYLFFRSSQLLLDRKSS